MSEMYGRATIFNLTNVLFVAFTLGCGFANSMAALIILRFFAGFSGSACLALGGGVIADIIAPDQRGKATALWSIGPLIGPVVPDLGIFLTSGYRSYLWRIHIPTHWLAMDLLRPYYWHRNSYSRNIHLPQRNQSRSNPRTKSSSTP